VHQNQSALAAFVAVLVLQNKTKTWSCNQNLTLYVNSLAEYEEVWAEL